MFISKIIKRFLIIGLSCFTCMAHVSYGATTQKVLILNASHKGDDMSDSILNGIESVLPMDARMKLYIEYMDIKRHSINDSFVILRELYVRRYADTKLDVIIACDDLALQFVLENKNSLFPRVPLVFCGVENNDIKIPKGITGIMESDDIEKTYELARQLQPDVKTVVAISDQTSIGKSRLERLKSVVNNTSTQIKLKKIIPDSISDLIKEIKKVPEKSIVFFLHFAEDTQKNQYSPSSIINMFQPYLKAPLYTSWYYPKANGILGGKMINGLIQGKLAANMVADILKGQPVDSIPVLKKCPNSYIFNYQQMKRFDVRFADLPGGSMITHKPTTFLYKYRHLIGTISLIFVCLLGVVLILFANIIRRKNAERSLEQQIRVLNSFMETIPNPVFYKDDQLRFLQCNVAFQALIGMDEKEITGKTFEEITTSELASIFHTKEQLLLKEPGFQSFETQFQRSNGEIFTVIMNHATITDENGVPSGLIGSIQDITGLKVSADEV